MSGVVKGIKKAFKSVVKFVKKALPIVLMAVAVYFTAGLALSAMPATAGFAASMPGFAGGGFAGLGIGSGATAGTGIFTKAAAAIGMGNLGSAGGLVGGAMAKGTTAAALSGAGISSSAIATGAAEAASAGIAPAAAAGGAAGGHAVGAAAAGAAAPAGSAAGATAAKAGMSIGEKLLLASTGSQAIGALLTPKPKDSSVFQGAFYGMDRKGQGGGPAILPPPDVPAATSGAPTESVDVASGSVSGQASVAGKASVATPDPSKTAPTAQAQNPDELFPKSGAPPVPGAPTAQAQDAPAPENPDDLFKPMKGVRYI